MCCKLKSRDDVIEEYHTSNQTMDFMYLTSHSPSNGPHSCAKRTKIFSVQVKAYCLVVFLHVFFEGGSGGVGGL